KETSSNTLYTNSHLMKLKDATVNLPDDDDHDSDEHFMTSYETPLRADAFELDDDTKIQQIEEHFREIMTILGLDLTDDSLRGTPRRVAKMYVKEVFSGLNPKNRPHARLFENKYKYDQM